MTAALVVILLVATGDAEDAATRAAAKTTHDALDEDALVVVRESEPARLNDVEAQRIVEKLPADVVVVVSWQGSGHLQALASVRIANRPLPIERRLVFSAGDPAEEKGKSIGFAIAALLPRIPSRAPEISPTSVIPPPPSPPAPVAATQRSIHSSSAAVAVDTVVQGALGEATNGIGAELSGALWFADGLVGTRVGIGARFGEVTEAAADSAVARVGLSFALRPIRPSAAQAFGLGARVGFLGLWQHLQREDSGSSGSWILPAFEGWLEASHRIAGGFSAVAGVGTEVGFGPIRIYVDNQRSATVGMFRGLGELGVRWER